jgi:hypothetical protein
MFSNLMKYIANQFDPCTFQDKKIESIRQYLKASAISCNRCNSLGLPTYETSNRYRCKNCGRQFTNCNHGLMCRLNNMATNWIRITKAQVKQWYEKAVERV